MNMNLYSHDDAWLMVDCGVSFSESLSAIHANNPQNDEDALTKKFDRISADPSFIAQRADALAGIVITHAHEDHLGALVDLWSRFKCPVYTTRFTALCLRHKLAESRKELDIPVHIVDDGSTEQIGPFEVQWLALTHSMPESYSLMIRTRVGSVFHTGDWKIDFDPVVGKPFDPLPFKQLASENIAAMVCDSTNADRSGRSVSEGACYQGLFDHVSEQSGRVLVTCFGSNIARLITLFKVAKDTGRYVALLGRSLHTMHRHAKAAGYWPSELDGLLYSPHQIGYLPSEEILIIATGSQGEPRAALSRLARNQFRDLELEEGDSVIFSSIVIPGNEEHIHRLIEQLEQKKISVITKYNTSRTIHASGHPSEQDLLDLYGWVQPSLVIPTHGEQLHLAANAKVAKQAKVPRQMTGFNGDLFELVGTKRVHKAFIEPGRIPLESN